MRDRPTLGGSLAHVRPLQFAPGTTVLGCQSSYDRSTLGSDDVRTWLESRLSQHFGAPTRLVVERSEREAAPVAPQPETLDEIAVRTTKERRAEKARQARSRPAVAAVREELGAEISGVRVIDET